MVDKVIPGLYFVRITFFSFSRTTLPYHPLSHDQSRSMQSLYDGAPNIHPGNSVPIHPDVRFIKLPFYDIVDELIKPTSLGMFSCFSTSH